ncbi:MAG: alpha/beta hydrolase [Thermoplasmataceae archaeon]
MYYRLISGNRLRYEIHGEGVGVLILHGLGGDLESMIPISRAIDRDCTRVLVDLPCHGGSDDFSITLPDLVKELISLMGSKGLDKFYAIGVSLGSIIIEEIMLNDSDNILGAVLLSPASEIDSQVLDRVSAWASSSKRVSNDVFSPEFLEQHRKEIEAYDRSHPINTERLYYLIPNLIGFSVKGRRSNARVNMVVAEYDDIFGLRMNNDLKQAFPAAIFTIIRSGHAIHREDPRGAARIASEFFFS